MKFPQVAAKSRRSRNSSQPPHPPQSGVLKMTIKIFELEDYPLIKGLFEKACGQAQMTQISKCSFKLVLSGKCFRSLSTNTQTEGY